MKYLHMMAIGLATSLIMTACIKTAEPVYPTDTISQPIEKSLLTDAPCGPPCWYGIIPGKTTLSEAKTTLADISTIRDVEVQNRDTEIQWRSSTIDWGGGLIQLTDNGTVKYLSYRLEYRLTLKELIDAKGPPDGFFLRRIMIQTSQDDIDLIWLNKGLQIHFTDDRSHIDNSNTLGLLTPDILISSVSYFESASDIDDYFQKQGSDLWRPTYHVWTGYQPAYK